LAGKVSKRYEEILRGIKGVIFKRQIQQRNRFYKDGKYDTIAVQGEDINLTLDAELQRYGEQLINKRGGLLLLSLKRVKFSAITAPSYDPSILVGDNVLKTILYCITTHCKTTLRQRSLAEYPPDLPLKY
jgi:penicillin-binding protein 2